jgi:hypothetical protein
VAFESSVSKSRALTRAHSREPYVAASPPTYVVVGFQAERVEQPVAAGLVDVDVLVEVVLVEVVVVLVVVTGRAGAGHESERTDEIHTASACGNCQRYVNAGFMYRAVTKYLPSHDALY